MHYASISYIPEDGDESGVILHYTNVPLPRSAGVIYSGTSGRFPGLLDFFQHVYQIKQPIQKFWRKESLLIFKERQIVSSLYLFIIKQKMCFDQIKTNGEFCEINTGIVDSNIQDWVFDLMNKLYALLEPVCCKKQHKKFLTSYWFVE